jgi:hypothetical protein
VKKLEALAVSLCVLCIGAMWVARIDAYHLAVSFLAR